MQSNQHSLPHQDDCKIRMGLKKRTPKPRTITELTVANNNRWIILNCMLMHLAIFFIRSGVCLTYDHLY